jgi:hypothetical protein
MTRHRVYVVIRKGIRMKEFMISRPEMVGGRVMIPFRLMAISWFVVDITAKKVLKSYDRDFTYKEDEEMEYITVSSIEDIEEWIKKPIVLRRNNPFAERHP